MSQLVALSKIARLGLPSIKVDGQRTAEEIALESEVGVSAKNRPIRIYRLTDAGLKHLEEERSSFEKMFAGIMRVLAAVKS